MPGTEHVLLLGRASPEKVAAFYTLMDLVALPRRSCPVTEIVSPIKPLEAAAQGKRVLMSDVAPLADLAKLCPSHFRYFTKGDVTSLTTELARLLTERDFSPPPCQSLQRMTWSHNVEPMVRAVHSQKPI